jgi:hypothetical protein
MYFQCSWPCSDIQWPRPALGVLSVQISSKTEQNGITAGQPHIMAWPVLGIDHEIKTAPQKIRLYLYGPNGSVANLISS